MTLAKNVDLFYPPSPLFIPFGCVCTKIIQIFKTPFSAWTSYEDATKAAPPDCHPLNRDAHSFPQRRTSDRLKLPPTPQASPAFARPPDKLLDRQGEPFQFNSLSLTVNVRFASERVSGSPLPLSRIAAVDARTAAPLIQEAHPPAARNREKTNKRDH